uniref:Uncharacterized protein n=1 Tax=Ditylenchus dipsaci TaxID=166011 RepID=A0A915CQJ6_9BILA
MGPRNKLNNQFVMVEKPNFSVIKQKLHQFIKQDSRLAKFVEKLSQRTAEGTVSRKIINSTKDAAVKFRNSVEATANWIHTLPKGRRIFVMTSFVTMAGLHTFDEWFLNFLYTFFDQEQVGFKVLSLDQYVPDVAPDIVFGGLAGIIMLNPMFGVVWAFVGGHIEWAMKKAVADTIIAAGLPKVVAEKQQHEIQQINNKVTDDPNAFLNEKYAYLLELRTDSFVDQILGFGTAKILWHISGEIVDYMQEEMKSLAKKENEDVKNLFHDEYVQDITIGAEQRNSLLEEHGLLEELQNRKEKIKLNGSDVKEIIRQIPQVKDVVNAAIGIILRQSYKTKMPQMKEHFSEIRTVMLNGMSKHFLTFARPFAQVLEEIQESVGQQKFDHEVTSFLMKLKEWAEQKYTDLQIKKHFSELEDFLKNQENDKVKNLLYELEEAFIAQFGLHAGDLVSEMESKNEKPAEDKKSEQKMVDRILKTDFPFMTEEVQKDFKLAVATTSGDLKDKILDENKFSEMENIAKGRKFRPELSENHGNNVVTRRVVSEANQGLAFFNQTVPKKIAEVVDQKPMAKASGGRIVNRYAPAHNTLLPGGKNGLAIF